MCLDRFHNHEQFYDKYHVKLPCKAYATEIAVVYCTTVVVLSVVALAIASAAIFNLMAHSSDCQGALSVVQTASKGLTSPNEPINKMNLSQSSTVQRQTICGTSLSVGKLLVSCI